MVYYNTFASSCVIRKQGLNPIYIKINREEENIEAPASYEFIS